MMTAKALNGTPLALMGPNITLLGTGLGNAEKGKQALIGFFLTAALIGGAVYAYGQTR